MEKDKLTEPKMVLPNLKVKPKKPRRVKCLTALIEQQKRLEKSLEKK